MADVEQVIRLAGDEDIHAVRGMLARAQAPRVMLVVPKGHPTFQRLVRLKVLARQAQEEGVQVALVSADSQIRALAGQLGLSAFRSVEAGRRARRWREAPLLDTTVDSSARARVLDPATQQWRRGRSAVLEREQRLGTDSHWGESILLAGLLFGMMILLSSLLLLLVPSAHITLVPRQQPIDTTLTIVVDSGSQEVNFFDRIIPAEVENIAVQANQGIATTGFKDVPATRATGEVLFLNVSGQPSEVPVNTIVSTSSGTPIRFRTTQPVSVPGELNARVSAPIEAVNPGPSGNVQPLQINMLEGAAANTLRVLNENPLEGGDVQQQAVVTAEDKTTLLDQLRQLLLSQGLSQLEQSLQAGDAAGASSERFIVLGTAAIEITAETYSASVDDPSQVLNLDLRARVSGISASHDDIERLARRAVREQVPEGYQMLEDGFRFVVGDGQRNEAGFWTVPVRAEGVASAELSGDQIRSLVRGRPLDEAKGALTQLPLAADPAIVLAPDWWSRMPYLPLRIFIRIGVLGAGTP